MKKYETPSIHFNWIASEAGIVTVFVIPTLVALAL